MRRTWTEACSWGHPFSDLHPLLTSNSIRPTFLNLLRSTQTRLHLTITTALAIDHHQTTYPRARTTGPHLPCKSHEDVTYSSIMCRIFFPFLHSSSFDATQVPLYLVLSMLCLAYQYGEDPESGDQVSSGAILSTRCFHRARALIVSDEERTDSLRDKVPMVQSYLLLQICAMMYLCGDNSTFGL